MCPQRGGFYSEGVLLIGILWHSITPFSSVKWQWRKLKPHTENWPEWSYSLATCSKTGLHCVQTWWTLLNLTWAQHLITYIAQVFIITKWKFYTYQVFPFFYKTYLYKMSSSESWWSRALILWSLRWGSTRLQHLLHQVESKRCKETSKYFTQIYRISTTWSIIKSEQICLKSEHLPVWNLPSQSNIK